MFRPYQWQSACRLRCGPLNRRRTAEGHQSSRRDSVRNTFWIAELTAQERSTLIATFGGWMLDGMDVMVYSFVIPTLIMEWHLSQGQAGFVATVTLLISAVGGWLAGIAAGRYGRTLVLQITIFGIVFFTFLFG